MHRQANFFWLCNGSHLNSSHSCWNPSIPKLIFYFSKPTPMNEMQFDSSNIASSINVVNLIENTEFTNSSLNPTFPGRSNQLQPEVPNPLLTPPISSLR